MKTLKEIVKECGFPFYYVSEDGGEGIAVGPWVGPGTTTGDGSVQHGFYLDKRTLKESTLSKNGESWNIGSTIATFYQSLNNEITLVKTPTINPDDFRGLVKFTDAPITEVKNLCICEKYLVLREGCKCGGC